ncbi:MAG: DUF2892 domain-containing protein [Gemmatimonadales bacterium]|nr:DUF2892 domain-containing protein [Gemmatimonadales bacterium]
MSALFARNEGTVDRILRVTLGVALLSLTVLGPQTPWGFIGLVPLATGLLGSCPVYSLIGLNTCALPRR